jgi:hypothetical protein
VDRNCDQEKYINPEENCSPHPAFSEIALPFFHFLIVKSYYVDQQAIKSSAPKTGGN